MNESVVTAEGFVFDPQPDVWHIGSHSGPLLFDFTLPGAGRGLRAAIKAAVLSEIRVRTSSHAKGVLTWLRVLLRDASARGAGTSIDELTLAHVHAFTRRLPSSQGYIVNSLRRALQSLASVEACGLSEDLVDGLATIVGEPRRLGAAVRCCSPTKGSLSDEDVARVAAALLRAHASGSASLRDTVVCLVVLAFGVRPVEVAALKVCDVAVSSGGERGGTLALPIAKGRGALRGRMRRVHLGSELAALLARQRDEAREAGGVRGLDQERAPLFQRARSLDTRIGNAYLTDFKGHMSARSVTTVVSRVLDGLRVLDHLGKGAHIFALRLRRTYATSLRDNGCSLDEIATALGHGGRQIALVYVEGTPALARDVDLALGSQLDHFVDAFGLEDPHPSSRPCSGRPR